MFNLIGCGGGSDNDTDGGSTQEQVSDAQLLEDELTNFNVYMESVADGMADLAETVALLNETIEEDDGSSEKTSEIGALVDQFATDSDALLADIEAMDAAEAEIEAIVDSGVNVDAALVTTVVSVGVVIYGLYTFGKKMKQYSDDMIEARKDWDEAAEGIMNGENGALEKYEKARDEMEEIGEDATVELTTKVTTELVLGPISPKTIPGIILKDQAGNTLQEGLKVMSTTDECGVDYEDSECKIGISTTDDDGKAVTPAGNTTIVVGGQDVARIVVEQEVPEDSFVEVVVDPVLIEDAADEMLPQDSGDDAGDADDSGDSDDSGDAGDSDDADDSGDDSDVSGMSVSATVSEEDSDSITYLVAVAVSGVQSATTVTLSVENGATSGSKKTISSDSTVVWSVTVLDKDAYVSVVRSDTGEQVSITLPAAGGTSGIYDGDYIGTLVTTADVEDCTCLIGTREIWITVNGTALSGEVDGTLSGNSVSGGDLYGLGIEFTGSITGDVMSGTWIIPEDTCCWGTFSLELQ